jgi:hypothetical protein
LEYPLALLVVPLDSLDLVLEFDIFVDEIVLIVDVLEVFPDLG